MKGSNFLQENNARFLWHPMTSPEDSQSSPPKIITESSGVEIQDIDGNRVVDAVSGLWNVNLGYSCQPIKDANANQLEKMPYYSTFRGTTNDAGAMVRKSGPNLIMSPPLVLTEANVNTILSAVDAGFSSI